MATICKWLHVANGALVLKWTRAEDPEAHEGSGGNLALDGRDVIGHRARRPVASNSGQAADQEHAMSLGNREQRQLRRIETELLRSDHDLAAMLGMFGRLHDAQSMPAREQAPCRHGRVSGVAAWITGAFAAVL
jgi:Protein of unknown function (DUF3040)